MLDTCEKWLGLVNSYVYSLHQTRAIYQVPYSVDSKLPGSFEIHWVRQYLLKVVLFEIKDLQTSARTGKLKRNFYVGHVNIFPNLWHWHKIMVNYIDGQCYTSVSFTSCLDNKKKIYWYQFLLCRPNWPLSHWHSRGGAVFYQKKYSENSFGTHNEIVWRWMPQHLIWEVNIGSRKDFVSSGNKL